VTSATVLNRGQAMRAAVEAAKTAVAEGLAPLIEAAQREHEEATREPDELAGGKICVRASVRASPGR
jgi:hypothetical protein